MMPAACALRLARAALAALALLATNAAAAPVPDSARLAILCGVRCEGGGYDVLRGALAELGWQAGRNLALDIRGGEGDTSRLPELAHELVAARPDVLIGVGDPLFHAPSDRIPKLALAARLPTMYLFESLVEAGGLVSYGPDNDELARQAARQVDRILRGAKPGDLPVVQPTRYRLVVNRDTASALVGVTIPESVKVQVNRWVP